MKSILKVTAGILLLTSCQKNNPENTREDISKSNPSGQTVVSARSSGISGAVYDAGICIYNNGDIYIAEKTTRKIYKNNVNSLGTWVWLNRCVVPALDYNAQGIDIAPTYKKDNNGVIINDLPIMVGNDPYQLWRLNNTNFWDEGDFHYGHKRIATESSSNPIVDSEVFLISGDDRIYNNSFHGTNFALGLFSNMEYFPNGHGVDIDVYNNVPYIIGLDQKIYSGNRTTGWTQLAGNGLGKRIATDKANGKIWIIGVDFKIYSFNSSTSTWVQYPGNGIGYDICAYNGIPYILASNNTVWKGTGTGWLQIR